MGQIFVSHSKQDQPIVDFLARVAAGTKVKLIFEELERIVDGDVNAAKIHADIQRSSAVFVVVTKNLLTLPHTRDWVLWESGVAANRDIWVFEPRQQLGQVNVITPFLKHYALFELTDPWFSYLRQIIESYDDSHVLPTVLATGGLGAGIAKGEGAIIGAGVGLFIAAIVNPRPQGMSVSCIQCASTYAIHLTVGELLFRCPVCNKSLLLSLPSAAAPPLLSPAR
jgi:hypothetical protein